MLDAHRDFIVRWPHPDTRAVELLRQVGAAAVVTPVDAAVPSGLPVIAELAAAGDETGAPRAVAGLRRHFVSRPGGGTRHRGLRRAPPPLRAVVCLGPERIHWRVEPAHAVLAADNGPACTGRTP